MSPERCVKEESDRSVDAVGFTGFRPQKRPIKPLVLDADGRETPRAASSWTRHFRLCCSDACWLARASSIA
jgi:hypothetical protein